MLKGRTKYHRKRYDDILHYTLWTRQNESESRTAEDRVRVSSEKRIRIEFQEILGVPRRVVLMDNTLIPRAFYSNSQTVFHRF